MNLKYCGKHDKFFSFGYKCIECILEEDPRNIMFEIEANREVKKEGLQTRIF